MTMIAIAIAISWVVAIAFFCCLGLFFHLRAKRYERQSSALNQLTEQVKRREISLAEADRRVEAILGGRVRR